MMTITAVEVAMVLYAYIYLVVGGRVLSEETLAPSSIAMGRKASCRHTSQQ